MDTNIEEARMKLYDHFVDSLVSIYEPDDAEVMEVRGDMMSVVEALFDSVALHVDRSDGNRVWFVAEL